MEGGEVSHSWWGETVATLKLVLQQPPLQPQALRVLAQVGFSPFVFLWHHD